MQIIYDFLCFFNTKKIFTLTFFFICTSFVFPQNIVKLFSLIILPSILIVGFKKRLYDTVFILSILFSFLYASFTYLNGYRGVGDTLAAFVNIPLFYIIGRHLVSSHKLNIYLIFFFICELIALPVIVDVIRDINVNGFVSQSRALTEYNDDIYVSATILGLKVSLSISALGVLFSEVVNESEKLYRNLFLVFSILGIICVLHMVNRTGIVIGLFSMLICMLLNYKASSKLRLILIVIMLITTLYVYFTTSEKSTDVMEAYLARESSSSYDSSSFGGRTELWIKGLHDLFNYPLGMLSNYRGRFSHNLWLDTAATSGLLPFFILVVISIIHIKKSIHLIKATNGLLKSLILCCNIGFFLNCFVEPAMEGCPLFIWLFFLFMGVVSQLDRTCQKINKQNHQY